VVQPQDPAAVCQPASSTGRHVTEADDSAAPTARQGRTIAAWIQVTINS